MKSNNSIQAQPGENPRCSWLRLSMCSVLLMTLVFGCSAQPAWKGRSLSAWLGELHDLDQKKAAAAETALKQIGTNAIPYLLQDLTAAETSVDEWLKTGGRAETGQTGTVLAFRVLASSAAQALPALGVLLTNRTAETNLGVAYTVAQSMAAIGEQAKPQLVAALNHPSANIRRASLVGLIDLGKNARDTIPSVMERLKDGDAEARGLALFFVSDVSDERELKVRMFKEASQDSNRQVRSFAEKELSKLGVQTR